MGYRSNGVAANTKATYMLKPKTTTKPATTTQAPATAPQGAMAPVSPAGAGGHWALCKALHKAHPFVPTAVLSLATVHNPWRAHSPGAALHTQVLVPLHNANPQGFTVQQAIAAASAAFGPKYTINALHGGLMGHLCYLYTGGCYLTVNGQHHAAWVGQNHQGAWGKAQA